MVSKLLRSTYPITHATKNQHANSKHMAFKQSATAVLNALYRFGGRRPALLVNVNTHATSGKRVNRVDCLSSSPRSELEGDDDPGECSGHDKGLVAAEKVTTASLELLSSMAAQKSSLILQPSLVSL